MASVAIAATASAAPEVLLTIGPPAPPSELTDEAIAAPIPTPSAAHGIPLHEGDVVPLPACDAALLFGLRATPGPPAKQRILVRILKKQSGHSCTLEVQTIAEGPRAGDRGTDSTEAARNGTSNDPAARRPAPEGTDLPCGSQLIEIRESRPRTAVADLRSRRGSIETTGRGCNEPTTFTAIEVQWLN